MKSSFVLTSDVVIQFVLKTAQKQLPLKKVFLFGSRARGTEFKNSDYDLAIFAPGVTELEWSRFYLKVLEEKPSLHKVDLLNLEKCNEKLKKRILKEGKILYG